MSMYSTNGVQRSINIQQTLAGDTVAIQVSEPNASQFGWTTNDLKGVKDLGTWVNAAMESAISAAANAQYVQESVEYVQNQTNIIEAELVEANSINGLSQALNNDFNTKYAAINLRLDDFNNKYADFLLKYADFIEKYDIWKSENP